MRENYDLANITKFWQTVLPPIFSAGTPVIKFFLD